MNIMSIFLIMNMLEKNRKLLIEVSHLFDMIPNVVPISTMSDVSHIDFSPASKSQACELVRKI